MTQLTEETQARRFAAPAGIDLQGHRGARGLFPENSTRGFLLALEIGVTTLEMDAVISGDGKVVVSHEPWFRGGVCCTPEGERIPSWGERSHNIFSMPYDKVMRYRCGGVGHPRFPEQEQHPVCKPLLSEVITRSEAHATDLGRSLPKYSVEIKSRPRFDGRFHPPPEEYARLLIDVFRSMDVMERAIIQSFDPRPLRASRHIDPRIPLALLVENRRGYDWNVARLGFTPELYSPFHKRVDRRLVGRAHSDGAAVVPWTVNDPRRLRTLLENGVDGIITDYPDSGREVIAAFLSDRPA